MLEHCVAWCNSATRTIARLEVIARDACQRYGLESVEYDDALIALVLLKNRREDYRNRIAEESAPWFEVGHA